MTKPDGKLVRLESGGWAQYRQVEVQGPSPLTMLIAVELSDEEARQLLALPPSTGLDVLH